MDAQEIKDRIKWFHEETFNKGNTAVIEEFLAPNYIGRNMLSGQKLRREDMKQGLEQGLANSSEVHITLEDILVEGNRAAFRWVSTGTDKQGRSGKMAGFTMYTFVDGKVTEDYFLNGVVNTEQ